MRSRLLPPSTILTRVKSSDSSATLALASPRVDASPPLGQPLASAASTSSQHTADSGYLESLCTVRPPVPPIEKTNLETLRLGESLVASFREPRNDPIFNGQEGISVGTLASLNVLDLPNQALRPKSKAVLNRTLVASGRVSGALPRTALVATGDRALVVHTPRAQLQGLSPAEMEALASNHLVRLRRSQDGSSSRCGNCLGVGHRMQVCPSKCKSCGSEWHGALFCDATRN